MRAARAALPAAASKRDVLGALAAADVLVISGATGCGKSTQVCVCVRVCVCMCVCVCVRVC
jgi:HrpA-like RNA helicase